MPINRLEKTRAAYRLDDEALAEIQQADQPLLSFHREAFELSIRPLDYEQSIVIEGVGYFRDVPNPLDEQ